MANALIIDDDKIICQMLSSMVELMGHNVTCAVTLKDGIKKATSGIFDVVFLDIWLPDGNGLDILPVIRETTFSPEVIIMTGEGEPDGAELAIKNGAWGYIEKPSPIEEMQLPFVRALQYREEKKRSKPLIALKRDGIIGNSPQIKVCLDLLAQAANSHVNAFITGETGTGKELFARAIHDNSPRAHKNFVVVDCAALPESLVESALFGYEKGAFTGADRAQDGLIKQADGGTLFLDEIGELPMALQKAFLRVLQEHRFRPIGSKREVESDFRVVAATNRNLDEMVQQGQFRKDLLFRFRSFVIELPPLREHTEDIEELAMYHLNNLCKRYKTLTKGVSPDFFEALAAYGWPGNVRELVNALDRALAAARNEPTLFPMHLPSDIRIQVARDSVGNQTQPKDGLRNSATLARTLPNLRDFREAAISRAEQDYLRDLMSTTKGHIKQAGRISGLSRPRLYALLKKYNISRQS
ncbi:MAG: sigma-54-dependent Fis family transcriptional regulator [Desulfobulbaceae bacterium]|nr:sigma-54-dependent Fis family transcriptional regulator [Desulfobulbaceae bacterium]